MNLQRRKNLPVVFSACWNHVYSVQPEDMAEDKGVRRNMDTKNL